MAKDKDLPGAVKASAATRLLGSSPRGIILEPCVAERFLVATHGRPGIRSTSQLCVVPQQVLGARQLL